MKLNKLMFGLVIVGALFSYLPCSLCAQTFESRVVTSVKVENNKAISSESILAKVKTKAPHNTLDLFAQAVTLASGGYLFDAVTLFEEIVKNDQGNELADDALVNAGLCYIQMSLYRDAIAQFTRVIQGYPKSTIANVFGNKEVGRTAAKALFCRLRCHSALGDGASAKKDLESLKPYTDSYVTNEQGTKKTFYELGCEAFATQKTS
jgi:tetratricopeptide (TPR) repeat protein